MPPRGYKRRRSVVGGWHRRIRLRRSYQRPYYRRSAFRGKARKYTRRRRSYKKRSRRYRRRFGSKRRMKSFQKKIIHALAPERVFYAEYGQEHTVGAEVLGKPSVYFTPEVYAGAATVDTVGNVVLFNHSHVMAISDQYSSAALNQIVAASASPLQNHQLINNYRNRILFTKAKQVSLIRNQSNEAVHITAYYCRPRGKVRFPTLSNIYQMLATGFANNGIDPTSTSPSGNDGFKYGYITPFQSHDFTKFFKIYKVKKRTIQPSQITPFSISARNKSIRPFDWTLATGTSGTTSWSNSPQLYSYLPPQKFLLFKLVANPAGYGASQTDYSKYIQMTTPTVIMDTSFKYFTKMVPATTTSHGFLAFGGMIDSAGAGQNPAIIVPDGDVVGEEKDAF